MPAAANASAGTSAASDRRSILRRCPKPARTSRNSHSGSTSGPTAGAGRRSMRTSADSTLGTGWKTVAGTRPTTLAVAQ